MTSCIHLLHNIVCPHLRVAVPVSKLLSDHHHHHQLQRYHQFYDHTIHCLWWPAGEENIGGQHNEDEEVEEASQHHEEHKDPFCHDYPFDHLVDVDIVQNNLGMLSKFPHSKVDVPINVWDKDFQPLIAVEDKLWIYLLWFGDANVERKDMANVKVPFWLMWSWNV